MPRTDEQNQHLREQSQERIVAAGLELFARHGYERTTIRMIAEAAGISQGLMYNYYGGKNALLQAIFAQCMDDVRRSFAASAGSTPGTSLERLIRASFAILQQNLPFWTLSYGLRSQPAVLALLGPAIQNWSAEIRSELEQQLHAQGATNPPVEATVLFALIDGIAQHYSLDPAGYPLDAVVEHVVAHYCPR